jgi:tetratricopeptide (TPR) repeat protein
MAIRNILATSIAASGLAWTSLYAAQAPAIDQCIHGSAADLIEACTRVLGGKDLSGDSRTLAYWRRASAYSASGRLTEAIEDYTQALDANRSFQPAYAARGAARFRLGVVDAAIADYDAAIRLNPRDALTFHNRAVALRSIGENLRAIRDYSEAVRLDGSNAESLIGRGVAYQALEEHSRAVTDFTSALIIRPRFPSAYSNRGVSYRALGDEDRAMEDFEAALRVDPRYVRALVNRGAMLRARGDVDGAFADFDRAVTLEERFAGAYFNRGLAYFELRQFTKASAEFGKAAELQQDGVYFLWLYLAKSRAADEVGAEAALRAVPATAGWQASLANYLTGKLTRQELLELGIRGPSQTQRARRCEALFFAGQKSLLERNEIEATELLQSALQSCPGDFLESEVASAEIRKLGAFVVDNK